MSNGAEFFYANKQSRNDSFSFPQTVSGENTALVHPLPVNLGNTQKVAMSVDGIDGSESYGETPFGGDGNNKTHVQPANIGNANRTLPGEQQDPRLC